MEFVVNGQVRLFWAKGIPEKRSRTTGMKRRSAGPTFPGRGCGRQKST